MAREITQNIYSWQKEPIMFMKQKTNLRILPMLIAGLSLGTNAIAQTAEWTELMDSRSGKSHRPRMLFTDTSRGQRFAKDPDVVRFKGKYYMYYSIRRPGKGFAAGIATSEDLQSWVRFKEIYQGNNLEEHCQDTSDKLTTLTFQESKLQFFGTDIHWR